MVYFRPIRSSMKSKERPELFYCTIIFMAAVLISFVLLDLIYPFPESVISGDPWWRHNHRIAIVTVVDNVNYDNIAVVDTGKEVNNNNISTSSDYFKAISVRNKKSYAEKYGYKLVIKGIEDWDREASWANIPALLKTMNEYPNFDWLWWIDSKLFVSNPVNLISTILHNITLSPKNDNKEMIISYDCFGINTASFLIRNSHWSRKFLKTVYNPRLFKDLKDESIVMQTLIDFEDEVDSRILFVPLRTLNALPLNSSCSNDHRYKWHNDDFVMSLAGCEELQKDCEKRLLIA
ncbi:hypothetical protein RclHR1_02530009 [Rhizophagus clarus]|uniref:Glycosyltransferase family 34 protein n=1 Tax=Rhizophagus clarus TaxID=94130 RepID=A0A2Z6RBV4_9GLOM|nr:hypothetical protein RclHR1_02530009 [Rhizophagus clarus]GES75650.1 glycosyltransferase family 34 protein [Rhizophagus clarus]